MFTDRTTLRTTAYGDRGPLAARLGTVLDAGCGLGTYVERLRGERTDLRVLPLDLSAGMRPEVEAFLGAVRARVADEISRHGVWRLGNQVGVLTCR